ncbi:N/A [soil metagenome]
MNPNSSFTSPRLDALRVELETDRAGAIERFWTDIEATGSPLIERFPDDPTAILVTFLWREREPLRNLRIFETLSSETFDKCVVEPIPGTDIWFRSVATRSDIRSQYQFIPNDSLVPRSEETDLNARTSTWVHDPLNPKRLIDDRLASLPRTRRYNNSIYEGPDAPPMIWLEREPTAHGELRQETFTSAILANERPIWIYTPPGFDRSTAPYPLLVHFDGEIAEEVMLIPRALDTLISHDAIPPIVAVLIGNGDRSNELPCNADYARFIAEELIPYLRAEFNVTADPAKIAAAGQSYGGLASTFLAHEHSDLVGNVVSQSGSFWWKPDPMNETTRILAGDSPNFEWLSDRIARSPRVSVRFWLEAGTLEERTMKGHGPSLLDTNRHMRRLLEAKGYEVAYREHPGGHDYAWWRGTIADGLIWVFQP